MYSFVKPNAWVVLQLPSEALKVVQIVPNTTIWLGKYGSFQSNLLIERPYHLTYELQDKKEGQSYAELRIVPASELHADTIAEEEAASKSSKDDVIGGDGVEFELVGENGDVVMRSNRETIDDSARQTLTMEEIEELKKDSTDAGKDLIAKLMMSHTALDQKTAFSLAKYKLLKTKKYLRQFTILPLDVAMLTQWLIDDKDPSRIMEMREELLSLVGCWGNVHFAGSGESGSGRWLVVDEVGGLLVAAMAERMGILNDESDEMDDQDLLPHTNGDSKTLYDTESASSNTITLVHTNSQPNLSLLKYFDYIPDQPSPTHPLTRHLHTISWLQLISPQSDATYAVPPKTFKAEEIAAWKSGKRGTYYRKHRRYNRVRHVVDDTLNGGFDGLLVASAMDPVGILKACVPLLAGGAQVAVFSPTIEPLAQLADYYSTSRRTAFITTSQNQISTLQQGGLEMSSAMKSTSPLEDTDPDFPVNPTLLLNTAVQTSKVRKWQVLPGRTHPLMTGRGGAEGYVFTGTRVLPAEGKIEARGNYKRRKIDPVSENRTTEVSDVEGAGPAQDSAEMVMDISAETLAEDAIAVDTT